MMQNIEFHTYTPAAECQLKVVLRSIPTNISTEEIESELESQNFTVKMV